MTDDEMADVIRIYCNAGLRDDEARHPVRRPVLQVSAFVYYDDYDWKEYRVTPYRPPGRVTDDRDSRTTLVGDEPFHPSTHGSADDLRMVYDLWCPKCRKHYEYREETLFPALNRARQSGVASLTLTDLDAIVRLMASEDA